jgi:hypothetical protein
MFMVIDQAVRDDLEDCLFLAGSGHIAPCIRDILGDSRVTSRDTAIKWACVAPKGQVCVSS